MNTALGPALAGLFIAIGLAVAGWFGAQTLVNARTAVNTATVKGLSERFGGGRSGRTQHLLSSHR